MNGKELIVGDVYVIEPGMMIPADSILIQETKDQVKSNSPYVNIANSTKLTEDKKVNMLQNLSK